MKVEIICAANNDPGLKYSGQVAELLISAGCEVYAPMLPAGGLPAGVKEGFVNERDLVVALGGDGTIMRTAHRTARRGIPIIGINLGHVGYLAELEPDEIPRITEFFDGKYTVEKRGMLEVSHFRAGARLSGGLLALNDVTVTRGGLSKLLELSVEENGRHLMDFRSDGIIVSTPTGSTAYSLSAGGPVLDPELNAVCVIPVCPQSMMCRPVVLDNSKTVSVVYRGHAGKVNLALDGREAGIMEPGDTVTVSSSRHTANFVRFEKERHGFFEVMKDKLSRL